MNHYRKVIECPCSDVDLKLILDTKEVYPDDPGMGTPALVEVKYEFRTYTATYHCATDMGEVDNAYTLTDDELDWLNDQMELVDKVFDDGKNIKQNS